MITDYKDKYHSDRCLSIELVEQGNYFGIRSNVGTLLVVLTSEDVARLAKNLNAWIDSKTNS